MEFGRKLSFIGHTVHLSITIRNRLHKDVSMFSDIEAVKIYDKHPTKSVGAQLITTVVPTLIAPGRMIAIWEIPATLARGTYFDEWNFKVKGISVKETKQFFVETDFTSFEEIITNDYKITLNPTTVFTDSKEYIRFKMEKPETTIFPKAQIRITSVAKLDIRFTLKIRKTGPGLDNNNINQIDSDVFINALFPGEPVIIAESPVVIESEFLDITSFEDTAYFLLDAVGVTPGAYNLQLKIFQGEEEKVLRPMGLRINDSDLADSLSLFDPRTASL